MGRWATPSARIPNTPHRGGPMRFGFMLIARDLEAVAALARLAEEQGITLLGCADVPPLFYDPYAALMVAARHTHHARLGPMVTNPQTRHPLVLANLAAALDQLAPGRTYLGLGRGNAGVHGAGLPPAALDTVARAATCICHLLAGEPAAWDGTPLALRVPARPVPVMLAGSGPRSLRLAGRLADLALLAVGAAPDAVTAALGWVDAGAAAAGRSPAAVERWAYIDAAIALDRTQARLEAATAAVARANLVYRGPARDRLPPDLRERMARLVAEYDYSEHMRPGRSANYRLAEHLGLLDYCLEQFAIAGTPDDCTEQLARLRAAGLENVCFNLATVADLPGALRLLGEAVFPTLRDR